MFTRVCEWSSNLNKCRFATGATNRTGITARLFATQVQRTEPALLRTLAAVLSRPSRESWQRDERQDESKGCI